MCASEATKKFPAQCITPAGAAQRRSKSTDKRGISPIRRPVNLRRAFPFAAAALRIGLRAAGNSDTIYRIPAEVREKPGETEGMLDDCGEHCSGSGRCGSNTVFVTLFRVQLSVPGGHGSAFPAEGAAQKEDCPSANASFSRRPRPRRHGGRPSPLSACRSRAGITCVWWGIICPAPGRSGLCCWSTAGGAAGKGI